MKISKKFCFGFMLFFMKSLSASDLVDLSYSDIVAKLNNLPENIIKNEQETISVFLENNAIDFEFTVNNNKYKLCQKYDRLDNVFDVFLVKKNNRNLNAEDYFNTSFIIKYDQKNDFFILAFYHPKMKLNVTSKLYSKEFKQDKIKDENYYDGFPSIIDFYESKLSDYRGRLIDDILAKNDDREFLEEEHDYIQWLFPKKSVGHALAYLWNQDVTKENINNSKFKNKLRESFKMMLNFYHLKYEKINKQIIITKSEQFENMDHLLVNNEHNLLRISRILESLYRFSLVKESKAFYNFFANDLSIEEKNKIDKKSYKIWSNIVGENMPSFDINQEIKQEIFIEEKNEEEDPLDITHLGLEFYKENNQIMIKNINFNEIFPQDENRNNFLEDIEQTIEILNKREYPDHALALKNFINIAKTL